MCQWCYLDCKHAGLEIRYFAEQETSIYLKEPLCGAEFLLLKVNLSALEVVYRLRNLIKLLLSCRATDLNSLLNY